MEQSVQIKNYSGEVMWEFTLDEIIAENLKAWKTSRLNGVSVSMCMDSPGVNIDLIKAFDEVREL